MGTDADKTKDLNSPLCPSCGEPLRWSEAAQVCPACERRGQQPVVDVRSGDDDTADVGVARTDLGPSGSQPLSQSPARDGDTPPVPPVIAGYAIARVLGSGGLSVVYAVVDAQGRELALKVSQRSGSTEVLELQHTEIELLARLHNPAVVRIHAAGVLDDGRTYLIMERVHGQSLRTFLAERRRLDVLQAISLVRKVADAMAYCHDMGVVHLDLKPSNIMVVDAHALDVKVLDFGISRLRGSWDAAHTSVVAGTPGYVAPECLTPHGREKLDARADLYALGVIFYELLAGRQPFDAATASEMVDKQLDGHYLPLRERVPEVPAAVERLIDSLLATNPGKRYPSAGQLARELRGLYYAVLTGAAAPATDASEPRGEPGRIGELAVVPDDVPLAGRSRELGALVDMFRDMVATGAIRHALVMGPAGVGKTRLLSEFLSAPAVRDRALVAYGRCPELHGLVPYSSLRAALARLAHAVRSTVDLPDRPESHAVGRAVLADPAILCALVPELREFIASAAVGDAAMAPHGLAGTGRVAHAIAGLLAAVATLQPVIFLVEDIHWADAAVVHTLTALAQRKDLGRVMVLATSRPVEPSSLPSDVAMLYLGLLDPAANDDLLSALARGGSKDTIEGLKRAIPLLAAGIPLFNKQVMCHLEIEGYLRRGDDGSLVMTAALGAGYTPPDSVSAALTLAIDQLPGSVRSVLSVAARVERSFLLSDIAGLGLFSPAEVHAAVLEAERRHLCRVDGDRATLVHDAVREQLARLVAEDRWPDVHGRIAGQLRRRGAPLGTLAYHLDQAGQAAAAASAFLQAALEAERLSDPGGACRELERAVELLLAEPRLASVDDELVAAVFQLCRIGSLLGRHDRALSYLAQCTERFGAEQASAKLALNASLARLHYVRGDFPSALGYSRLCLAAAGDEPQARMYQCGPANIVGRALAASGRFAQAIEVLTRGCELAREAGEFAELSHSEGLLGVSLGYAGDHAAAARRVAAARRTAHDIEDPVRLLGAYFYETATAEARHDPAAGLRAAAGLLQDAERQQLGGLYLYLGTMFAGRHSYHLGQVRQARTLLGNAIHLAQHMRMTLGIGWAYAFCGDTWYVTGDLDQAMAAYDRGRELAGGGTPDEYAVPMCLIGLAHCAAQRTGDPAEVASLADAAIERLRAVSNRAVLAQALERYGDALEILGDAAGAERRRGERAALIAQYRLPESRWRPTVAAPAAYGSALADVETLFTTFTTGTSSDLERDTELSMTQSLAHIEGYLPEHVKAR
jgi:eukaryotic-like serine/threonine-protein kinase